MPLPPLLYLSSEASYEQHFLLNYVNGPDLVTFDGIGVRFFPDTFRHAFFRDSSNLSKDKARFDKARATRMEWIRHVLQDPSAELYRRVVELKTRRIALEPQARYAVIIQINRGDPRLARFITAYVVDSVSALQKMRQNPVW